MSRLISIINQQILNPLIAVLVSLGILVFAWGLVEFIWNADDETKRARGRQHIIWGLFGVFIMVGVWGIIGLITRFVNSIGW